MQNDLDHIDNAIEANKRLRSSLKKNRIALVRSHSELAQIKATCMTWFKSQRSHNLFSLGFETVGFVDKAYQECLDLTDRSASRKRFLDLLDDAVQSLLSLRSQLLVSPPAILQQYQYEPPPDFGVLIYDDKMVDILTRRWNETRACLVAPAPLAATIMMGSLLEAILLGRINLMPDKAPAFTAPSAPRDQETGKTYPLRDWTLRHFVDVAHDLRWIGTPSKDIAVVLRDYRNYVHPVKELSHGLKITSGDSSVLWSVFVSITKQLLESAKSH